MSVQKTITANSKIVDRITSTITSDSEIKDPVLQTITADSEIKDPTLQTITSDSYIFYQKDFNAVCRLEKELEKDFYNQLKINQLSPTDPTSLVATDLKTGESIQLTWNGTNYGWNVYKDVGGSWIKQNLTLITSNYYTVGALTTGVTYTFKVVGVNGIDIESTGVTQTGTPTFDLTKYSTKPIWNIYVDTIEQTDAVLERVELGYDSSFSQVSFYIPKNPSIVTLTAAKQIITVKINSKLVFTGYLIKRTDIINNSALKVNYIAISKLWDYTWSTINKNYNEPVGKIATSISTSSILNNAGCPYPDISKNLYDSITVADNTKLELMESILKYVGNYKVHCDENGVVSCYKLGSPLNVRTFEIGKHILDYEKNIDVTDQVDKVTVYSAPTQRTSYWFYAYSAPVWNDNEVGNRSKLCTFINSGIDGNLYLEKAIWANQISNIQAKALVNEKPVVISYVEGLEVLPKHVGLTAWPDGSTDGKKVVLEYQQFTKEWKSISSTVNYNNYGQLATIRLSPPPICYETDIRSYTAHFKKINNIGAIEDVYIDVYIMFPPIECLTNFRIEYTYQDSPLSSSQGSGTVQRTYHDSIVPILINTPSEFYDNTSDVNNYLSDKALSEYNRLSKSTSGGRITVLGDETIKLRSQVNGMEVMRVVHDFSSGFITYIDLTNEQFYYGDSILRKTEQKNQKGRLAQTTQVVSRIPYDKFRLADLVGFLNPKPATTTDPKAGISNYSD